MSGKPAAFRTSSNPRFNAFVPVSLKRYANAALRKLSADSPVTVHTGGIAAGRKRCSMPRNEDYMPTTPAKFDPYYKNIVQYVSDKTSGANPDWTHIPQTARTELVTRYTAWNAAYGPTLKPTVTKQEKDEMWRVFAASKKYLRGFVNAWLRYHPDVTDDDREKMGLHVPNPKPTPTPDPATRPEFNIRVKDVRALTVDFRDEGSESRARPKGMGGAVIHWVVMDHPAASTDELVKSYLATRTPYTIVFTDEERGKIVSIAMQWQNRKGRKGKFSEIQTAIIP
jgi:hypothetical protein